MRYSKYTIFISTLIFQFISQDISFASYHETETQYDTSYSRLIIDSPPIKTPENARLQNQQSDGAVFTFSKNKTRKSIPTRILHPLEENLGLSFNTFEEDELGQQLPLLSPTTPEKACDKKITSRFLSPFRIWKKLVRL